MTHHYHYSSDLPWSVFGRRAKPFALAATIANFGIALGLHDPDAYFNHPPHTVVLVASVCAVVSFMGGWWLNTNVLVLAGLLLTIGVFAARTALAIMDVGLFDHGAWLSVSWMVAAGGAFLPEKRAPRSTSPEAYGRGSQ